MILFKYRLIDTLGRERTKYQVFFSGDSLGLDDFYARASETLEGQGEQEQLMITGDAKVNKIEILSRRDVHRFADCSDEELPALKKCLDLPMKKNFRYMRRSGNSWAQYEVKAVEIDSEWPGWCGLTLDVPEIGFVRIHHAFFAQMQKAGFEKEMTEAGTA